MSVVEGTKGRSHPMPRSSLFWDVMAKRYSRQKVAHEDAYREKLKKTQDYLKPHMEVLEFGCGTGTTALIHAPHVKHILATDISRKMLEIARAKARDAGITNVTFEQMDIANLEAGDESFDVVMGHSILHLLPDRKEVIAKVHRLLKPGGIFISSTVCMGNCNPLLKAVLVIGRSLHLLPPVQFFTQDQLVALLTDAGFSIDHQWRPAPDQAAFIVAMK